MTMILFRRRDISVRFFIGVVVVLGCLYPFCLGQSVPDTSFGFAPKSFDNQTFSCTGNSSISSPGVIISSLNLEPEILTQLDAENYNNVDGRCIYDNALDFSRASDIRSASFSTMFKFYTLAYEQYIPGQGLTFYIASGTANSSNTVNSSSTTNVDGGGSLDQSFAIELSIVPNYLYARISINNATTTTNVPIPDITSQINLYQYYILYAWIDYDGERGVLDLRLNNEANRPCKAIMSPPLPPNDQAAPSANRSMNDMYTGFFLSSSGSYSGQIGEKAEIWDWSFSTNGKAENIFGDDVRCDWISRHHSTFILLVTLLPGVFLATLVVLLLLAYSRKVCNEMAKLEHQKADLIAELKGLEYGARPFTYEELNKATNGFEQHIGKGGFADVYKGTLQNFGQKSLDKTTIAVKRITKTTNLEDAKQLVAEVKVIGRLRHINIVPLLGWCYDKGEMLLVYKFMERGDLEMHLFPKDSQGSAIISWQKRMEILKGVAAALVFLHDEFESENRVVHRDVKPTNIMLDAQFNARLGDFGLARLYGRKLDNYEASGQLMGTLGYMAPEYAMGATVQTDVYSFGILILVMATGRRALDKTVPRGLVAWVRDLYDKGRTIEAADVNLIQAKTFDPKAVERVIEIGLFCSLYEPEARPTMREVLTALHSISPMLVPPLPSQFPTRVGFDIVDLECQDTEALLGSSVSLPSVPMR